MDDPEYSMAEVVILVGSDPGMATRFLRLVNSPLNRRVHKIETVSHAVSMLGMQQIHDIVLSTSVAKVFEEIHDKNINMKKFWQRSFYCAVMARQLALECGMLESDRFFTTGLLHDIGHLVMYLSIPKESQQAILKAKKLEQPLYQVERELIGFDYAKLGGHLMRQWDLPGILQITTRFHPEPGKTSQFALETALLHLSYLLVTSDLEKGIFGEGPFIVDPMVWHMTRLTGEECLKYRQKATYQLSPVAHKRR